MPSILTVTLNPAIDITTGVARMVSGRKLRCEAQRIEPGGGGVNVSRVVKELGGDSTAVIAVAGTTGTLMQELILERGINAVYVQAEGMTRQSLAVHDRSSGEQYRFVLPGSPQGPSLAKSVTSLLARLLDADDYAYVVASGSLPPGLRPDFYGKLANLVRERDARFILDTSGPALTAALQHRPFLMKPDRFESEALAKELGIGAGCSEGLARAIVDRGGSEAAIVTFEEGGAVLATQTGTTRIPGPAVNVVSKVGAGDSFIAALSHALCEGWPIEKACAYGVAAAAAAVTTEATELAFKPDIDRIFRDMDYAAGA